MKKNYYLIVLLLIGFFGKAQIITIPDDNFKTILLMASPINSIAKDLNGNNIKIDLNDNAEIEVSEALTVFYLNIYSFNISNLDGINSFSSLTKLYCNNNQITNLDVSGLTNLECLYCNNNLLTNLNVSGLTNLDKLYCYSNQITNLNLSGLTNLEYLYCNSNGLISLNVIGLVNLKHLQCTGNELTSIDVSGLVNLTQLGCSVNYLNSIDVSSLVNLEILSCTNNYLTNLDVSQNYNLNSLNCKLNNLTNIQLGFLSNLSYLDCSHNELTTLDISNYNNLNSLICNNNQLQFLNIKNGSSNTTDVVDFNHNPNLQYICADEFELNFIQNKITQYGYSNCQVNSYCSFEPGGIFYTIQGENKFDNENDGCDSTDGFIHNLKYSITDGVTNGQLISNSTGVYTIPVLSGIHTITPIFENPNYFNVSPTNVVVDFPSQTSPFTQNFCITPNGEFHDVEITMIPTSVARPGFDCHYKIIYKNKGNQLENGTLNLAFDDAIFDFVLSSVATSSQTFGNLNWNYANLQPFETRTINVVLNLNSPTETPAVNGNDILNIMTTNTITNTDIMISDNAFSLNQTVVNSYDPNDKTCLEGNTISPDRVGGFVHYMIRFENTGTFPAENIVVKDMIDTAKFDISSLVPLHASHNYFTKITGNKVEFIFENINLPFDDASNDGYVAFKIKTLSTLVLGDTFSNSANIYFDYNFPIFTNTATTTIAALSNPSFEFATYFNLYPNPTTNELNINLKSAIEIHSIQIYNAIGQLVTVQTGNALKVDVSNLKKGNYFIKINTNEGYSTSQFIKE